MSAALQQTLSPSAAMRAESALSRILGRVGGLFKPRDPTLLALENMLNDPHLLKDIGLDAEAARRELGGRLR
ncbi:hypothetical protein [Neomegalonema sp.]|uniref:hypothetical protein n=1 Tax=Neomegalonema sp. TaxID=2039713 RepID=UPI00262A9DC6|nr:hypothetical protein [Neomegalonema sp.]MDD2867087.1 hypothetical protein [Neomegalonema sp.]